MKRIKIAVFIALSAIFCLNSIGIAFANESNNTNDSEYEIFIEAYVDNLTRFDIENVELDDGSKIGDYNYKVNYITGQAKDPAYLLYYFNSALWITRDGVVSLSLDAKNNVRTDATTRDSAWNILSNTTYGMAGSSNWPTASANVQTFYWQYLCHWAYANSKQYWNLEPSSVASSYFEVIINGCNP